jgi:hypothetical protein
MPNFEAVILISIYLFAKPKEVKTEHVFGEQSHYLVERRQLAQRPPN